MAYQLVVYAMYWANYISNDSASCNQLNYINKTFCFSHNAFHLYIDKNKNTYLDKYLAMQNLSCSLWFGMFRSWMSCYSMVIYMKDKIMGTVTVAGIIWCHGIFVCWGTFHCLVCSLHFMLPWARNQRKQWEKNAWGIFTSSSSSTGEKGKGL